MERYSEKLFFKPQTHQIKLLLNEKSVDQQQVIC